MITKGSLTVDLRPPTRLWFVEGEGLFYGCAQVRDMTLRLRPGGHVAP